MGCIQSKRANRRVAPHPAGRKPAQGEVTMVQTIYLPLSMQPSLEEPRRRKTEEEVLKELKEEGLLKCEILREKDNGVAFYVSLDGNPYPSGKPRLLEPIDLRQEREKIRENLNIRMSKAGALRRQKLSRVRRKARIVSAKQRQAVVKREKADEEHRRTHKERLEEKMERASRNRQSRLAADGQKVC